ncbi:nucleoside-diphosphate kinase [Candidatus Spyradosoma sp. SGI.093]|uniref:nucleoside-diphosphate kinase n=1 Tax=Candidatus Spyradosoma sp. SGI.093 TaxID=3420583 RepID=UPI003D05AB8D
MIQKTLIILKPDCMEKNLAGTVLARFEAAGLSLAASKMIRLDDALVRSHYAHLTEKPFFGFLSNWMKSRPVVVAVVRGENAIDKVRELLGPTKSADAPAGTIRGDFGDKEIITYNVCHASDGEASAAAEIARFFKPEEVF